LQHFIPLVHTKDIRIEKMLRIGIFCPIVDDHNFKSDQFGYTGYGFAGGPSAARLLDSFRCARYYPTAVTAQLMDVLRLLCGVKDDRYPPALLFR